MEIVLLAGLWLRRSVWTEVCANLAELGHRPIPVELPGVDDASHTATLDDQLEAVLVAIDSCPAPVAVVGHSAACTLAWMAADRRPDRVHTVVLIGGFPSTSETAYAGFFPIMDGAMAFPGWGPFEGPDSDDLDEDARARIAADAVAVPEGVAHGTVRYGNDRRFDVPVVLVCPEFSPEQAREWIAAGDVPELAAATNVTFADIDSGHWPMVTQAARLAEIIDDIARPD